MSIGLKGNNDGSGAVQVGGSDAISISTGLVVTMNGGAVYPLSSGTAVASTSGTAIDFTGIPATAKRVTVMFSGVSTNGTSAVLVQIGAGSVVSTGYGSASVKVSTVLAGLTSSAGFIVALNGASGVLNGTMHIANLSSNVWVSSHSFGESASGIAYFGGGNISLGGTLDRVRITTVNGTDTFDAGSINILWE